MKLHTLEVVNITKIAVIIMDDMIKKLVEMRLTKMLSKYIEIKQDIEFPSMDFNDIFSQLVDEEYYSRKNHSIKKLIKAANFSITNARLSEIEYHSTRNINPKQIKQLSSNDYIMHNRNVLVFGATGCGKSYISNSLGINACESGYKVLFIRSSELLYDLDVSRKYGNHFKTLKKLRGYDLLIIDDFLLTSTDTLQQNDLMEIFEYRSRNKSTLITSQLSLEEWHIKLGGTAIADAILDRLVSNSYKIILQGDSLRKSIQLE